MPDVTRELWRAATQGHSEESRYNPELVGHLGVALFASPDRPPLTLPKKSGSPPDVLLKPFPHSTVLLSMDALQRWTWTRRGGERGDFIAVFPDEVGDAWVVAIESKGSANNLRDGRPQAETARRKLADRFGDNARPGDRQELLLALGQESFRAASGASETYAAVAKNDAKLHFAAVCVSTAREADNHHGDDLVYGEDEVLWVRLGGTQGLHWLLGAQQPSG